MSEGYTISRIEDPADFTEIATIEKEVFTDPFTADVYLFDFTNHPYSEYYKLTDGDKIIGYFGLWMIFQNVQITTFAVTKPYQRRGCAKKMMDFIIRYVKAQNCENITLEVRVSNLPAIALYEKYHFQKAALRKRYYENGEDAHLMKLDL